MILTIGIPPHPNPPPQGGRESRALFSTPVSVAQKGKEAPSPLVGEGRGGGDSVLSQFGTQAVQA